MANASAPNTAGELVTVKLYPGIVAPKADITMPAYYPDFDMKEPNPIVSISRADIAVPGLTVYNPSNLVVTDLANVAGTFRVTTNRIFRLGDACIATSVVSVCYKAAGNVKRS